MHFWINFVCRIDKAVYSVSRKHFFWEKSYTSGTISTIFSEFPRNSRSFRYVRKKLFAGLPNYIARARKHFEDIFTVIGLNCKIFRTDSKMISAFCQKSFLRVITTAFSNCCSEKLSHLYSKSCVFFFRFRIESQNCSAFCQTFLRLLDVYFTGPTKVFDVFLFQFFAIFLQNVRTQFKKSSVFFRTISAGFWNLFFTCPGEFFDKNFGNKTPLQPRDLFRENAKFFSIVMSKPQFTCSKNLFQVLFQKKTEAYIPFLDVDRRIFGRFKKTLSPGLSKMHCKWTGDRSDEVFLAKIDFFLRLPEFS